MDDIGPVAPSAQPLRPPRGKLTLVFLGVILAGLALSSALRAPDTKDGPMVGEIAPEITAELFAGGTFRLSDHLEGDGRPLVLNLWASWCLECREEFPALSSFAANNPNVKVVGVAVNDQRADAVAFWEETGAAFDVGYDTTGRLRTAYPGFGLPVTFVIDETGVVVHQIDAQVSERLLVSLFR